MADFTNRQMEIIDESIKLIAKGGIQELTIKNIANSIGISEPAIYRHFNSKIDILLSILSFFESNAKNLFQKIHSKNISNIKKIESVFLEHCKAFAKNPPLATVIFSEEMFINEKVLTEKESSIMKLHKKEIFEIIKKGQKNGEIRNDIPSEQLSFIILGTLRLTVTRWRLSNFSFDIKKEGRKMWNAIMTIIAQ